LRPQMRGKQTSRHENRDGWKLHLALFGINTAPAANSRRWRVNEM